MIEYLMQSNLAANSTNDLLTDADTGEAQSRFVNRPSQVTMAIVANAVGVELEVYAGARTVVPRSTLEAGGTTGVFPNLDQKAFQFFVAAGEKLRVVLRETAGAATTDVMAAISLQPVA